MALLNPVLAFPGHSQVVVSPLLCFRAIPPCPTLYFLHVSCNDVTVYDVEEMEAVASPLDHLYRMPWEGNWIFRWAGRRREDSTLLIFQPNYPCSYLSPLQPPQAFGPKSNRASRPSCLSQNLSLARWRLSLCRVPPVVATPLVVIWVPTMVEAQTTTKEIRIRKTISSRRPQIIQTHQDRHILRSLAHAIKGGWRLILCLEDRGGITQLQQEGRLSTLVSIVGCTSLFLVFL